MAHHIFLGDCLETLKKLDDNAVDAVVTDPPYGLSFMGKNWDKTLPNPEVWKELLRVLKPGGYMVAFGAPRLYHRLAVDIEDAGWEIRDCLMWLYGTGFPKSLDVSKALDKAAGAEREVVGQRRGQGSIPNDRGKWGLKPNTPVDITAPATPEAQQWEGWGTALKPAWEPILLARKPLSGTVAKNVAEWGVGGINVEGCRVEGVKDVPTSPRRAKQNSAYGDLSKGTASGSGFDPNVGRWPANLVLDGEAAEAVGDEARFFYTAKASRKEREAGLDAPKGERANSHPTVKPLDLMRWLVRLIAPPGGVVLDPFNGSGSTGCAAVAEGFTYVGCELEPEYVEISNKRIAHWAAEHHKL